MHRNTGSQFVLAALALLALLGVNSATAHDAEPALGPERLVMVTDYGTLELGLYKSVAPKTCALILKLWELGAYQTNHIFRVDKGFVAQVADIAGGRRAPMDARLDKIARDTVPGEFSKLKHERGVLSLARHSDPSSGGSSFSILLGDAPHLDGNYAIFGRLLSGDEVLTKLEALPTRKEGIFVMPVNRIEILSTYVLAGTSRGGADDHDCAKSLESARARVQALAAELQSTRANCLPG